MTTVEILQHIGELAGDGLGIERKNPVDDVIVAGLVGRVEVAGLSRRLERPDDYPCGIGTQVKRLPVEEDGLQQGRLGWLEWEVNQEPTA